LGQELTELPQRRSISPKSLDDDRQALPGLVQKQDQVTEGQMALAGKVLWMSAVLGSKLGTATRSPPQQGSFLRPASRPYIA